MITRQTHLFLAVSMCVGVLLASGCFVPPNDQGMAPAAMMTPIAGELTIMNPVSRPSPMAAGNGAVYMTILNGLDTDVQLVSVESPASEVAELHETVDDNGVMRMMPRPDGFVVPAGGSVELKPGGKHVMLIRLVEALEPGAEIELTLNFDSGKSMAVLVPVTEMDGEMPMEMDRGTE